MIYELSIRRHNIQPHLDIEKEIQRKQDGLFTFTIRVNGGNICDIAITEVVDVRSKYLTQSVVTEKLAVSCIIRKGSSGNALRPINI
jgi:hypothetical protein